ncbi:MAG: hypothetical protein K0S78_4178 [Thermomicrobiales bacterium]|nr:hypothetical protein [Thermomicrobiales bacterium]MDF3043435.1 hypothetical protein [Thermomicrobiales bacterium]
MKRSALRARIALMVVVALLALPGAQLAPQVAAKPQPRPITRTFNNSNDIQLPLSNSKVGEPVSALLYPSAIQVSGMPGKVRDVNLTLNNFNHTYPREVEVLLVGPGGQTAIVLAHVQGGNQMAFEVTLRLDDEAEATIPELATFQTGTYRPTNATGTPLVFNDPAPRSRANAALSIFDGTNPNGTWRLFVQDEYGPTDGGDFAGGWTLEITSQAKVKNKKR